MQLPTEKMKDIEAGAQDVLAGYFGNKDYTFPIPIEDIAKAHGLSVSYGEFAEADVSGILKRKDGGGDVYISSREPGYRQTFTIAHELGHLILHEKEKKEEILYRRDTINLTREDRLIESEANWFAASLLMPEEVFTEYWNATKDISLLADYFGVSPTAVRLRIKNLGLE